MAKPTAARARTNRAPEGRTLPAGRTRRRAPALPEGDWHPQTLRWWRDIWASPMAAEWDASDLHGLIILAALDTAYFQAEGDATARALLAREIRLQRQCYGLTPADRRRLQWDIRPADPPARTRPSPALRPVAGGLDPRAGLVG
jgi:hypothetical protein